MKLVKWIRTHWVWVALFAGGLVLGILLGRTGPAAAPATTSTSSAGTADVQGIWTCAMHPQIRMDRPGKCPICGMDLIPVGSMGADTSTAGVHMSSRAMALADVRTTVVGGGAPGGALRTTGRIDVDERRLRTQLAQFPGRIERLFVDVTGTHIAVGDPVAEVYAPDLVVAQQELLRAAQDSTLAPGIYRAAKEKLRSWKLTDAQIHDLERGGRPRENFTILADVSGTVLKRLVVQGDQVMRGQPLLRVAALDPIWAQVDLHESDLAVVRVGDPVSIAVPALPGSTFKGRISFIDPLVDPRTRVARARVELANPGVRLMPDMYFNATITPTHAVGDTAIVVPASAVLWTGVRSVVYVKHQATDGLRFTLREVVLGPMLDDTYVIRSGLQRGEEIATNGVFSIDAAAQLQGLPSMMDPAGGAPVMHHHGSMESMPGMSDKAKDKPVRSEHAQLKVIGNCDLCKERIEKAALSVTGVRSAVWDVDDSMLTTEFMPGMTTLRTISKAVAGAGHDTELDQAREEDYEALPECCQYRSESEQ
ncbi:MAG: efflux RND transporter periplasmic adaptor subunit [Flavobacteriales bacterium]|nr:efflux RND transporter periplasmic adaptor subunit [Flavobacteriales bacterium]MCB9168488.1 efflux RND transporter periplasmic adaptor subunit [Flavobacteriales bacterium]